MHKTKINTTDGFSAIELLITLIIATVFVLAFHQMYVLTFKFNAVSRQRVVASHIAYSTLREFHTRSMPSWFICNSNTNVSTSNPAPPGQLLKSETLSSVDLPSPVTQTVYAIAPHGCTDTLMPIKIWATVKYGNPVTEVSHALYIGN